MTEEQQNAIIDLIELAMQCSRFETVRNQDGSEEIVFCEIDRSKLAQHLLTHAAN